jgi:hypothetical protein
MLRHRLLKPGDVEVAVGQRWTYEGMFTGAVERWTEPTPAICHGGEPADQALARILGNRAPGRSAELFEAAFDAHGALLSGVIPAAWITEALFTFTYNALIKRRGDRRANLFIDLTASPSGPKIVIRPGGVGAFAERAGSLPGECARISARRPLEK